VTTEELLLGDARNFHLDYNRFGTIVIDPPFDQPELIDWAGLLPIPTALVFTSPGRLGETLAAMPRGSSPAWMFVWDTGSPWRIPGRPLTQSKLCLWYGDVDTYRDDAAFPRINPAFAHLAGTTRGLSDVFTQSLRWLHAPDPKPPDAGRWERLDEYRRHQKPIEWVAALLANCTSGPILDPFAGTATTLLAARLLERDAVGIELDPGAFEYARARLDQFEVSAPATQQNLFE
jgi:hypothetical protein